MITYADQLRQVWEDLERDRESLFRQLRTGSDTAYYHAPAPGKGSVGQIANHLFLSEQLSIVYVRNKMNAPEAIPPYRSGAWLGLMGIRFIFISPLTFKAPTMTDMWSGQPIPDAVGLDRQWKALRQEMIRDVLAFAGLIGNRRVYRDPRAGRISLRQMLLFFDCHFRHHYRQVERQVQAMHT